MAEIASCWKGNIFKSARKTCVIEEIDCFRVDLLTLLLRDLSNYSIITMYLFNAAIFLAIIPLTLATDCMVSDSLPWPFGDSSGGSSSGGGSVTDECAQYAKDSAEYQACVDNVLQGQCNSVGGSACEDPSDSDGGGGDLISPDKSGDSGLIRRLEARGTLSCTSDETCYQYTNGSLVCFDLITSK